MESVLHFASRRSGIGSIAIDRNGSSAKGDPRDVSTSCKRQGPGRTAPTDECGGDVVWEPLMRSPRGEISLPESVAAKEREAFVTFTCSVTTPLSLAGLWLTPPL